MPSYCHSYPAWRYLLLSAVLASCVAAVDVLKTSGFQPCMTTSDVKIDKVDVQYNRVDKTVTFDVSGSSAKRQNATALLTVEAYGNKVYTKKFNPCDEASRVDQLCPGRNEYEFTFCA